MVCRGEPLGQWWAGVQVTAEGRFQERLGCKAQVGLCLSGLLSFSWSFLCPCSSFPICRTYLPQVELMGLLRLEFKPPELS